MNQKKQRFLSAFGLVKSIILFSAATTAFSSYATVWSQASPSTIGLSLEQAGVKRSAATFSQSQSNIQFNPKQISSSSASFTSNARSITPSAKTPQSFENQADFLGTVRYPQIRFDSTQIRAQSADRYQIIGNLTLHGVTRPVTFNATIKPRQMNQPNQNLYLNAVAPINYRDFGITPPDDKINQQLNFVWQARLSAN